MADHTYRYVGDDIADFLGDPVQGTLTPGDLVHTTKAIKHPHFNEIKGKEKPQKEPADAPPTEAETPPTTEGAEE